LKRVSTVAVFDKVCSEPKKNRGISVQIDLVVGGCRNAFLTTPICHPLYGIIGDASFTLFSLLSMCTIDLLLLDATVLVCAAHCVCFSRLSRVPEQRTPQNRLAFSGHSVC